jgi:RNA polymerase sigma-70 factor, ECF subfamily
VSSDPTQANAGHRRDAATGHADALLAALLGGAPEAYESFVRMLGPRALAVARRFLRQEEEAKDCVQEAFLAAFKGLGSFAGAARLSTWFHRIVVNTCLMRLRARASRPEEPIDELLPTFLEDGHHTRPPQPWQEPADHLLQRKEVLECVRGCIDRLPESYRTVLLLRDIEELDTAETARLLGISEGAVKVRLHRARQALRGLLEPHLGRGIG